MILQAVTLSEKARYIASNYVVFRLNDRPRGYIKSQIQPKTFLPSFLALPIALIFPFNRDEENFGKSKPTPKPSSPPHPLPSRTIYHGFFPLLPSSTPLATPATPFSTPSVNPCSPSPTAFVPVVLLIVLPKPRPAVPTRPPAVREMPPTAVPSCVACQGRSSFGSRGVVGGLKNDFKEGDTAYCAGNGSHGAGYAFVGVVEGHLE